MSGSNLFGGADGLAEEGGGEVAGEGAEGGKEGAQEEVPARVVVDGIGGVVGFGMGNGAGGVEKNAEDGLRGAGVGDDLMGEEEVGGDVVSGQRRGGRTRFGGGIVLHGSVATTFLLPLEEENQTVDRGVFYSVHGADEGGE